MINEKMGVPDNIENVAERIFNRILLYLKKPNDINFGENKIFYMIVNLGKLNFHISVILNLNKVDVDEPRLYSMQMRTGSEFEMKRGVLRKQKADSEDDIIVNIATKTLARTKLSKSLNKKEFISHIAHELKHLYDAHFRNPTAVSYSKYSSFQFDLGLQSVREFLYLLYYVTLEESLVRPTEFYTDMVQNNITKVDFRDYVNRSEIISTLKNAESQSLEKLKQDIKNDPGLDKFIELMNRSDYESVGSHVDDVLNILFINITNISLDTLDKQIDGYKRKLVRDNPALRSQNVMNILMGDPLHVDIENEKELRAHFIKHIKSLEKYENNVEKYFEILIKDLKFDAKKTKRKLIKLYDMLPDTNKNESILNWELFNKLNSTPIKTKVDWSRKSL